MPIVRAHRVRILLQIMPVPAASPGAVAACTIPATACG